MRLKQQNESKGSTFVYLVTRDNQKVGATTTPCANTL